MSFPCPNYDTKPLPPAPKTRWGFKSKKQLPLFMVWREFYDASGDVEHASVLFNSRDWIWF